MSRLVKIAELATLLDTRHNRSSISVQNSPRPLRRRRFDKNARWQRPEYDFTEVEIAQDVSPLLSRAVQKKVDRFLVAGYEFSGKNDKTLKYIKRRILEIELATRKPFKQLLVDTVSEIVKHNNCLWEKVRSKRSAPSATVSNPIAGYYIIPMRNLEILRNQAGELKAIKQRVGNEERIIRRENLVHFYKGKKPGFSLGTPEYNAVLEDISLLRRIEENVEDLIEQNLFPLFHYTVGTDLMPETQGPDGELESVRLRKMIEYMPSNSVLITDHRHNVKAIGSEGRALQIQSYLDYFKSRTLIGLGVSSLDLGESGDANRSTASTLSKGLMLDVEALQQTVAMFINFYVLNQLLLEGPFGLDALLPENRVEISFGVIDTEQRLKIENQAVQLYNNNLLTHREARAMMSLDILEDWDDTQFKLTAEPLALIKALGPNSAAAYALAASETSAITPEGVRKEAQNTEAKTNAKKGRPTSRNPAASSVKNKVKPANQNGARAAAKLTYDEVSDA